MPPPLMCDVTAFDFEHPLYDLEAIRRVNPQRDAMEQLTGIVHVDPSQHLIVGFKDLSPNEFWIRGHMPGYPLMPGVLMCECAAQLGGFYARSQKLIDGDYVGFGGIDEVRFRAPVFPGDRLILAARVTKLRLKVRAHFDFQGVVGDRLVVHGTIIGTAIQRQEPAGEGPL